MPYLWVALGSALGGTLRFALSTVMSQTLGGLFPWWTLLVNVLGCFAIGVASEQTLPSHARALLIPGFCGGFTTFSAFSLEFVVLQRNGRPMEAWAYVAASVVLCLAAVSLGAGWGRRG
jgi:CrcB protein